MTDVPFETRTYEQMPRATSLSPDALTGVQEPGAPMAAIEVRALLGRLISTDTAYETRAALLADLAYDAPALSLVYADPTPAYNGWYRKTGASGAGSWTQFEKLSSEAAGEIAGLVEQAQDARDAAIAAAAPVIEGLTAAELAAIRKARQQAEQDRQAAQTARINRFVSSVHGNDTQPGRTMSRAKATIAGLISSLATGIVNVTASGAVTGGTPGTYRVPSIGGTFARPGLVEINIAANGTLTQGANGWTRAVDPGDYLDGSATPTLTIPAAANLPGAALAATLGRTDAPGDVFGFECGNVFQEQMVVRSQNTVACSYPTGSGNRRLPYFDCTAPVPLWTNVSGNIWEATLARAPDYENVGGEDNYSLFLRNDLDNPGHDDAWLKRKPTAIVEGDAGLTYNIPQAQIYAENNPTCTVRLRAPDGIDPNTLALRYNRRTQGVLGRHRLSNFSVDGIAGGGHLSAQGVINAGTNFDGRRLFMTNGGKHCLVAESGLLKGTVCWNTEVVSNRLAAFAGSGHDCINLTFYRNDVTGLSWKIQESWAINPPGAQNAGYIYTHASGPSVYEEGFVEGGGGNNGAHIKGNYAKRQIFRGLYLTDLRGAAASPTACAGYMAANPSATLYYEMNCCLLTADAGLGNVSSAAAVTTGINAGPETWSANRSEIVIRNVGYHNFHDQVLGQSFASITGAVTQKVNLSNNMAYMKGRYTFITGTQPLAAGSPGIKDNILVRDLANIGSFVFWVNFAATFTGYCDYQVYIDLKANPNLRWRFGATNYTFANWQALGLWDQNSVVLNAAQAEDLYLNGVAGYLAGDHRLNPACALTFADGTPIVSRAAIREYYHYNTGEYVAGQPAGYPVVPTNGAECHDLASDPSAWDYQIAA